MTMFQTSFSLILLTSLRGMHVHAHVHGCCCRLQETLSLAYLGRFTCEGDNRKSPLWSAETGNTYIYSLLLALIFRIHK